jgi:hypothetical protein
MAVLATLGISIVLALANFSAIANPINGRVTGPLARARG